MNLLIKKLPTIILRITAFLSAIAGLLVCIFGLPSFGTEITRIYPEYAFWQYPVCAGLYLMAACFYFVLFHFWFLLNGIDRYDKLMVKNLKMIRLGAIMFGILYFIAVMPILFLAVAAETEDSNPGIILIAAFINMLPLCAAATAAILERIADGKNCNPKTAQ
ncbi:MAG: DUF2975 domain-containing protein [Bacteroidales bacterium]|nr:DUF2975 domain-containing protein [Bacteroidales bacterium]